MVSYLHSRATCGGRLALEGSGEGKGLGGAGLGVVGDHVNDSRNRLRGLGELHKDGRSRGV